MNFIMHRDKTVATPFGHVIEFKKGEPTYVPPMCREAVMAAGAVPEDELVDDEQPKSPVPVEAADREPLILAAMEEILLKNQREDFTATGAPHAKAISAIVGFTVNNKERDVAWVKFQADRGEAKGA